MKASPRTREGLVIPLLLWAKKLFDMMQILPGSVGSHDERIFFSIAILYQKIINK